MTEKTYNTPCGTIHYWVSDNADTADVQLVFLPGLTADNRLFEKQIEYFEGKYPLLVWDAPGQGASWPFNLDFNLTDKTSWLDGILTHEGFDRPVLIGQSMGCYVGQTYAELYPDKICGFVSIDSAPLKREYTTAFEIYLLKRMKGVYSCCSWKWLLKTGSEGVAVTEYGRRLMHDMMMVYDGDKRRYVEVSAHGMRMLAEAYEADFEYRIPCPALLICGKKDRAGSAVRYNRKWHEKTGIPIEWIEDAGHNSNTDAPGSVNELIESYIMKLSTDT